MDALTSDVRHACRLMRRQPFVSAIAALTLALGIGATTATFTVLASVLWRPLSYDPQGRLVTVLENENGRRRSPTSPANYLDWHASDALEAMTAAHPWSPTFTGRERAERWVGLKATPELFSLLDARPILGRTFAPADVRGGDARVVVLGHALWQRRFGGDPAVVGRTVSLDGEPYEIVGVMGEGFAFPPFWHTGAEFWTPLVFTPGQASQRSARMLRVFARLREGVTLDQARAEMRTRHERLVNAYPRDNANTVAEVEPLLEPTVGDARTTLFVLLGAVACVLLIACANVAGLLLARASTQAGETAVRLALGAGAWRILRQHLAYGLLLSVVGGGAGVLVSVWAVDLLASFETGLPRLREVGVDGRALVFATVALVGTGVGVSMAPALMALRDNPLARLRGVGERAAAPPLGGRTWLVAAELALAVVLLSGTGLMLRTVWNMQHADPGFERDRILTMTLNLPRKEYASADRQARVLGEAAARVARVPGVSTAAFVNHLPVGGDAWGTTIVVDGDAPRAPGDEARALYRVVTPGFFPAAGIRRVLGRDFGDRDDASAPRAAIVNETFARRHLPGPDVLGRRIALGAAPRDPADWITVVGVVADTRQASVRDAIEPELYLPYPQNPVAFYTSATLVARVGGGSEAPRRAIEAALAEIEPGAPITDVRMMAQVLAASTNGTRLQAGVLTAFALVAVALAGLGLYGVIAAAVGQRTREFGIRMAIGADRARLVGLVIRQAAAPVLGGGVAGLAAAVVLVRTLRSTLFGVSATDVPTFAAVVLVLVVVAGLACLAPAVRASRLNPVRALRS